MKFIQCRNLAACAEGDCDGAVCLLGENVPAGHVNSGR